MRQIFAIGLNHLTAPLHLREKFYISDTEAPRILSALFPHFGLEEGVLFSTCNRTELYGVAPSTLDLTTTVIPYLLKTTGFPAEEASGVLYTHYQEEAVHHLFKVASGMDSMILGETEIQGQVKRAFERSRAFQFTGPILNRLFEKALNAAKAVREKTGISQGKVSVASCVVEIAQKVFGEALPKKRVVVIGAGEIGSVVAKRLVERGCSMIISSRSFDRAIALAAQFGGKVLPLDDLETSLIQCDMAITSTHCPHFLLTQPLVQHVMQRRRGKPLFLVDISMPRNIEPNISTLENVYLYHLDDLERLAVGRLKERTINLDACEKILRNKVTHIMNWLEVRNTSESAQRILIKT